MDNVRDILNFLAFVIVFAVCAAFAFSVTLPMTRDIPNATIRYDKTAPKIQGYDNLSSYDGTMSKLEVVLMTQVQDFNMPEPKRFKVGTQTITIGSNYEGQEQEVGILTHTQLSATDPTGSDRYEVQYNFGEPPTLADLDTGNLIANSKAENYDSNNQPVGWSMYTTQSPSVQFIVRRGDQWVIDGVGTFEIRTPRNLLGESGTDFTGHYFQDITVEPNTKYRFTGELSCHRCEASFEVEVYNPTGVETTHKSNIVSSTGTPQLEMLEFTTPINSTRVRVLIKKGKSVGAQATTYDNLFADNLSLQKLDGEDPHFLIRKR